MLRLIRINENKQKNNNIIIFMEHFKMITILISVLQPQSNANEPLETQKNLQYVVNAVVKETRNFLLQQFF